MKLSNFYCDTQRTPYCEDPERGGPPCIFAIQGNEDCIVLMTSAFLINLYIAARGTFARLGFQDEYVNISRKDRMTKLFGESKSNYDHLDFGPTSARNVVILYKGKLKENSSIYEGDQTLTTEDLVGLVNALAEASFITQDLKDAVSRKIQSLFISPGGPSVANDNDVNPAGEGQPSPAAFFQSGQAHINLQAASHSSASASAYVPAKL